MRQLVLKSCLLALSVTNFIACTAHGQERLNNTIYYKLVRDIIFQDTIVPKWRAEIIESRVKSGQLTKEDSTKYYKVIKEVKLLLHRQYANLFAKDALLGDLEENGYLQKYLSKKKIKEIINSFPEDGFHDAPLVDDRIELITEFPKWDDYHKFSMPVSIGENRFLVYHYKAFGRFNYRYGVIIFSTIDNNDYRIEKEIILKEVNM